MPIEPRLAEDLSERMQCALRPRGPDSGQAHHDAEVLLVHRRLSIIDLTEAGSQPLWNEDRTACVIVNGEIYNFLELRHELVAKGHRFRSRSDSEIIVHLYEDRGIDGCCAALEGMFAFALWDIRSRDLYLVRDRLGIKPLVIAEHKDGVTFGSTLSAVMSDRAVPRQLNEDALIAVIKLGFVPSPWSAVRAARRVPSGSWLRLRAGRVVAERKWWRDDPQNEHVDDREMRAEVTRTVSAHLVADVPVGTLLSAGIDSGLVTALASRFSEPGSLEAWTVSHRGHVENEFDDAERAARHFGLNLHEIPVGGLGLSVAGFDTMVAAMDEPLVDASLVGLHELFRTIAKDRRVVLSGDGGDELFGGYDRHSGMPAIPSWADTNLFRSAAPGFSLLAYAGGRVGALGKVAAHVRRHPACVYLDKLRIATDAELSVLGIEPALDEPILAAGELAWDRYAKHGVLEQMLAVDRATSLADQMLAKVDTSSMAYSVESRVPLLGDRVIPIAKQLPASRKRQGRVGKICLREWYSEIAPPGLGGRAKTGFNSPVSAWTDVETKIGKELRERAIAGMARWMRGTAPASARQTFANAVVASWVKHFESALE